MSEHGADPKDSPWARLEGLLPHSPVPEYFGEDALAEVPDAVRRYFMASIAEGTPLAATVRLEMRGRIKLNRWLPFRAHQLLVPRRGTVWVATVAGVIRGSDRYVQGTGGMTWKILGLLPLVHAEGPDVTRSAAERAAGESIWVPTAMLPKDGVSWTAQDDTHVTVEFDVDGHPVRLHHELDAEGRLRASTFDRWGDPDNTNHWALHPFGVEVADYRALDGVTIPSRGTAGWHHGTERWDRGAFFEFEITDYQLVT